MIAPTESQLRGGALPVYLLEIVWAGFTYRFSTVPVEVLNDDGDAIFFDGGLEEPDFADEASRDGFSLSGESLALELVFPLDIAEEESKGRFLDTATGQLSMVLVAPDGSVGQTYERRFLLLSGVCSLPSFADPEMPVGWASFILEQLPSEDRATIIPPAAAITSTTWSSAPDGSMGQTYPFVIGSPGAYVSSDGSSNTTPATPCWLVDTDKLLVAGHATRSGKDGGTVTLYGDGLTYSATLTLERDGLQREVTTADISGASTAFKNAGSFHCAWPAAGGGLLDPNGAGLLEGLGDVCVWVLGRGTTGVDYGRWAAAAALLNRVKLGGYIDDPDITPWEWIRDEVSALVPLEVRQGPEGVFPRVRQLDVSAEDVVASVVEGPDWEALGPVNYQQERGEIVNQITLQWAHDAASSAHRRRLTVQAALDLTDAETTPSPHALWSQQRYGLREEVVSTDWIYHSGSAGLVLSQRLRASAYPTKVREFIAAPRWGWMRVGQWVAFTSDDLYLTDRLAEVVARSWDGDRWRYALAWDDAALRS